jgi:hypothetical protein
VRCRRRCARRRLLPFRIPDPGRQYLAAVLTAEEQVAAWKFLPAGFCFVNPSRSGATGSIGTRSAWRSRQCGTRDAPGLMFFLGTGYLDVSGGSTDHRGGTLAIWIQVRYVHAEHRRLRDTGVPVLRAPQQEPWGLLEMWITDPDGVRIVLVEVPEDHPLRQDQGEWPPRKRWVFGPS